VIYVSTSCIKKEKVKETVIALAEEGIKNIELSGGTKYYPELESDLLALQDKYSLSYIVHNYFPPPTDHFVLNLSTLDDVLYKQSIEHCKRAIALCKSLGSEKYGIHAGFLIDYSVQEMGNKIGYRMLNKREKAIRRYADAWNILQDLAGPEVKLYIENNVYSKSNLVTYEGNNPFLMTDYDGYLELKEHIDFNILLDVAHLKVSVNSLELDFNEQMGKLLPLTDYIHISGNDGLHDQNISLSEDAEMISALSDSGLSDKTITLEVYDGMSSILDSLAILENVTPGNNPRFINTCE